ncbi:MAG TPA: phosphatase PAP2 family protein [Ignavibacteria bacterium]|nr:phosphatase PAP2 family protein [Ignavibacteria bacterium]
MKTELYAGFLKSNSSVYLYCFAGFIIMSLTAMLPVEFISYKESDTFAWFWYSVTESGSFIGGMIIYILMMSYLTIHFKRSGRKFSGLILFYSIVFFTFVFSAGLNEFYLKEKIQKPRPNQLFLTEKGYIDIDSKTFLQMPGNGKKEYLENKFRKTGIIPEKIYPPVFNNWITDTGFSMPSGHALLSYFFGTVICFVIYKTFKKGNRIYCFIPLVWCLLVSLSRVITGMHFGADVTVGSFIGMLSGFAVISLPVTKEIFQVQKIKI